VLRESLPCLIFDLDGTLVDSEPLGSQALLDLLPDLDDSVDGLMKRYRGHRMKDVFDDLAVRIGRPLEEDFQVRYHARVISLYDDRLAPMPGAIDMLSALPHPMCVASNGSLAKMRHGLRVTGLIGFFGDNVFSAYDIGRWKPDPGLFLHAAERMGYSPEDCVVLEDSEAGIAAGLAAGMRVVRYAPEGGAETEARSVTAITHLRDLEALLRETA